MVSQTILLSWSSPSLVLPLFGEFSFGACGCCCLIMEESCNFMSTEQLQCNCSIYPTNCCLFVSNSACTFVWSSCLYASYFSMLLTSTICKCISRLQGMLRGMVFCCMVGYTSYLQLPFSSHVRTSTCTIFVHSNIDSNSPMWFSWVPEWIGFNHNVGT